LLTKEAVPVEADIVLLCNGLEHLELVEVVLALARHSRKPFSPLKQISCELKTLITFPFLYFTQTPSRVVAIAHYTVLRQILRKNRKWSFSAPHRIKILESVNTKIDIIDNLIELSSVPSLVKIGRALASPHMGEFVGYRYFFYFSEYLALGHAQSRRRAHDPTYCISIDAVRPKDVVLRVSTQKIYSGVIPPKPLILGREQGFPA
jgi:hypothetical protein